MRNMKIRNHATRMVLALAAAQTLLFAVQTREARAFPENVRHGYGACIACHVSPNGGGVLTPYGREISGALMSASGGRDKSIWGEEGDRFRETYFMYRAVDLPDWLLMGGDIRLNRVHYDAGPVVANRLILMQADLEAAATYKKTTIVGTLGWDELAGEMIARRLYLKFSPDGRINLRFGKFMHAFGINVPDHVIATKRGLGWDEGSESLNAELSWVGETAEVFFTSIASRPVSGGQVDEDGNALRASVFLSEKYKLGASFFRGSTSAASRTVVGPYALLGFTHDLALLSELAFQNEKAAGRASGSWGLVSYNKLDYELTQGLHLFGTYEAIRPSFSDMTAFSVSGGSAASTTWGGGIQFLPRPHLELQGAWRRTSLLNGGSVSDLYYLLAHFYL